MLGVAREVTHRSALIFSMVMEALSRRPRKRPTCTKTRVTAKATPETVIRKRSLSCRRFLRASETMARSLSLAGQRAVARHASQHGVDDEVGELLGGAPLDPGVVAARDVERHHTVHRRPQRLRGQVGVLQLLAQAAGQERLLDSHLEEGVGVLLGVSL